MYAIQANAAWKKSNDLMVFFLMRTTTFVVATDAAVKTTAEHARYNHHIAAPQPMRRHSRITMTIRYEIVRLPMVRSRSDEPASFLRPKQIAMAMTTTRDISATDAIIIATSFC
jgi:hypothetical protein